MFLGQEVHYYMVYIAYFTELILQICDYAQKWRIWRKNCKYALDENLHCHFCFRRKAAKFCHPVLDLWSLSTSELGARHYISFQLDMQLQSSTFNEYIFKKLDDAVSEEEIITDIGF